MRRMQRVAWSTKPAVALACTPLNQGINGHISAQISVHFGVVPLNIDEPAKM